MLERRRSTYRRAFAGGVLLGLVAVLPLVVLEALFVLVWRRPQLTPVEMVAFVGALLGLAGGVGVVLGMITGLVVSTVAVMSERFAKQRLAEPRWMARIYCILAAPLVAVFAAQTFAGRRAQLIPGHHLLAVGLGLLLLASIYALVLIAAGVRDRLRLRRWGKRAATSLATALLVAATGCYLVDQLVLRNLYGFFHVALACLALLATLFAVAIVYAAWRPSSPRLGRMLELRFATMVLLAMVTAGTFALDRVGRSSTLLYLAREHTAVEAKLLGLAARLRLLRVRANESKAHTAAPPTSRPVLPLRAGPKRAGASVLLITVDALRADHLGVHGYARKVTPHIDRLAAQSVLFERAYCAVPHTSFSIASLLTGKRLFASAGTRHATLASSFRQHGYKTAAFFPPAVFYIDGDRFRGFRASRFDFEYVKFEFLAAEKRVDQVGAFLQTVPARQPVFIWVHFFEPHEPYVPHPGFHFGAQALDRYDGEVGYVDQQVGRLLALLRKSRPRLVVALTADHGEAFGEHGHRYHGSALHEEQVRVPLLVAMPSLAARRVDAAAQTIDLAPTLLSSVGMPVPAAMDGRDLGPWLAGEAAGRLPPALVELHDKKALIGSRYKLIHDQRFGFSELYDLRSDALERKNIASRRPDEVARLQRELARRVEVRRETLQHPRANERILARARRGDRGTISALLTLAHGGTRAERREALSLLLRLRASSAQSVFVAASRAVDPGQSIPATIGAARGGDTTSLQRLGALLRRRDLPPGLRRDALLALAARRHDRSTAAELAALLQASGDVYERIELIEALGALGAAVAVPALLAQLEGVREREYAIVALGKLRASQAVPRLLRLLREERFVTWRELTARALGQIGGAAAKAALQVLVRQEAEASVVAAARQALTRLGGPGSRPGVTPSQ